MRQPTRSLFRHPLRCSSDAGFERARRLVLFDTMASAVAKKKIHGYILYKKIAP